MTDLISREAAKDAIRIDCTNADAKEQKAIAQALYKLDDVPSAQPERKKGEWIEDARTYYETLNDRGYFVDQHTPYFVDDIGCPECLAKFSVIDNEAERFKFCPNCGADMRGGE